MERDDHEAAHSGPPLADMAPLVRRAREFAAARQARSVTRDEPLAPAELTRRFGFAATGRGKPEVVLSEDVFVELGHPSEASLSTILATFDPGLVQHGRVTLVGPDLPSMPRGQRPSFAQVLILAVDHNDLPDPFSLENAQYLMHRLPGYMVRSVPGRLWVRVSDKGRAAGLDLFAVGSALISAFTSGFSGVKKAEVLFVTSFRDDVEALSEIAVEAAILSGKHKKLTLGLDGSVECTELNCDSCEEKPVCDSLRDVVVKRREERRKKK